MRRVSVVDAKGTPLMPCIPPKARILLKEGNAKAKWNKLGIFYIQLVYSVEPSNQSLALGVDPGTKYEGYSIVGNKDTVLNIMSEAPTWIKKAIEVRRQMRKARRYRNCRRRPMRFDNRKNKDLAPSTKARWQAKLRVIKQLLKILPISSIGIEDIKARTKRRRNRWNKSFSPLEIGKKWFYNKIRELNLNLHIFHGYQTQTLRQELELGKIISKRKQVFESHCVDAWVMAANIVNAITPTTKRIWYLVPLRFHRRQLHRFQFSKGSIRRPYGGTSSLNLKRGTLVKHIKHGLVYIGGTLSGRLSLHSYRTGKRICQNAKEEDCQILTWTSWRMRLLPSLTEGVSAV